jgi:multicomponent Na+:H+ antiporter subunit G
MMFDVIAAVLLLAGTAITLIAAIGLHRFDSVFARMHAATKAVTLGLLLAVAATLTRVDDPGGRTKLLLAAAMQLVTAPVAAQMVARAAYRARTELSPRTAVDELAGVDLDAAGEGDAGNAPTGQLPS